MDYSCLDQALGDFEHGPEAMFMDSIYKPKLDASFDEADALPSSVSSGFQYSVSFLITVGCSLLLA